MKIRMNIPQKIQIENNNIRTRNKSLFGRLKFLSLLIILAVINTGCIGMNTSVQGLLKPPKLPVQLEEIKQVLDAQYQSEIEYINPISGDHTTATQFVDLDSDGTDEVLIFHRIAKDSEPLRVSVLYQTPYGWQINETIKGIGFDINRVEYHDLNADGLIEIFVGWQGGNTTKKGLSIYEYDNGNIGVTFETSYTQFAVGDMTSSGTLELMIIELDRTEGVSMATIYDSNYSYMDEVQMEGFINGYYNTVIGNASTDQIGLFMDASSGAHSAFTDLLVYKDGEFQNVFYDPKWRRVDKTYKAYPAITTDVDNDGIVEIPLLRAPFGYEGSSMAETEWITTWYKWDGKSGLIFSSESYTNGRLGFEYHFPFKWKQNMTVGLSGDELKHVTLYYVDSYSKHQIPVIDFVVADRIQVESGQLAYTSEGYTEITRTLDRVYYAKAYDLSEEENLERIQATLEEIRAGFRLEK